MAKSKSTRRSVNPLVNEDSPGDTLNYCAAVLAYIGDVTETEPLGDDASFGRHLVLRTVQEALRYESSRVTLPTGLQS